MYNFEGKQMSTKYDVIIVGSGPAGIFAALELSQLPDLSILLLEKGKDLPRRKCPIIGKALSCPPCKPCALVSGWGGAGAFSDGKLTLSAEVGGRLREYLGLEKTEELVDYVDRVYLQFRATDGVYGAGAEAERLRERAAQAGLHLIPMRVRHLGTEHCRQVLKRMRSFLAERTEVETGVNVASIVARDGVVQGVLTEDGRLLEARYLIVAPGREGADWLLKEANSLALTVHSNPIDVGVRVEVPCGVLEELTSVLYESKLEFYTTRYGDRIRTFCMCPAGEVTMESTGGYDPVVTVNGHSYAQHKTGNSNFAVLVNSTFPPPFREPIAYGRYLAKLANIMSGGVIMQRLEDLRRGRCSTPGSVRRGGVEPTLRSATPGDIGCVLPYRFLCGIDEMLTVMDRLAPGVNSPDTVLYAVEVKFYSSRLQLSQSLESELSNMFAIGDGAGVSRGLIQASGTGVVAAREIMRREGQTPHTSLPELIASHE